MVCVCLQNQARTLAGTLVSRSLPLGKISPTVGSLFFPFLLADLFSLEQPLIRPWIRDCSCSVLLLFLCSFRDFPSHPHPLFVVACSPSADAAVRPGARAVASHTAGPAERGRPGPAVRRAPQENSAHHPIFIANRLLF